MRTLKIFTNFINKFTNKENTQKELKEQLAIWKDAAVKAAHAETNTKAILIIKIAADKESKLKSK